MEYNIQDTFMIFYIDFKRKYLLSNKSTHIHIHIRRSEHAYAHTFQESYLRVCFTKNDECIQQQQQQT